MALLVHVPARGGSKGLPGKNLRHVGGRSLVARAVSAGLEFLDRCDVPGLVLVDTDDERIAEEGRRCGAEVPFLRPAALAADDTPTLDTVLHALDALEARGPAPDAVVLLQPTSPLRTAGDIQSCWAAFDPDTRPSVLSVVAVTHPPELTVRLDDAGVIRWAFAAPPPGVRRQDLPVAYRPNGAVYIDTVRFLRERRAFVVEGVTVGVPMPMERSVDVDDAIDLAVAEALCAKMHAGGGRQE
jgi:CMP-N-acetylneuraminic acid synthetase